MLNVSDFFCDSTVVVYCQRCSRFIGTRHWFCVLKPWCTLVLVNCWQLLAFSYWRSFSFAPDIWIMVHSVHGSSIKNRPDVQQLQILLCVYLLLFSVADWQYFVNHFKLKQRFVCDSVIKRFKRGKLLSMRAFVCLGFPYITSTVYRHWKWCTATYWRPFRPEKCRL